MESSICSDDRQLESALLHGKPYWGSRVGHRVAQWEGVQREAGAEWGLCGKNHWTLKNRWDLGKWYLGTWGASLALDGRRGHRHPRFIPTAPPKLLCTLALVPLISSDLIEPLPGNPRTRPGGPQGHHKDTQKGHKDAREIHRRHLSAAKEHKKTARPHPMTPKCSQRCQEGDQDPDKTPQETPRDPRGTTRDSQRHPSDIQKAPRRCPKAPP